MLHQLIINASIEKTVLVDNHEEGDRLTGGGRWPHNVSSVYTPDCYQIGSRTGGYASHSMSIYRGPPRLTQDIEGVLEEQNIILRQKQHDLSRLQQQYEQARHNFASIQDHRRKFENDKIHAERQIRALELKIKKIRDSMESQETANVGALEDLLDEEVKNVKIYEAQKQSIDQKLMEKQKEIDRFSRERKEVKFQMGTEKKTLADIQGEAEQREGELSKNLRDIKYYEKKRAEYEMAYAQCSESVEKLDKFISQRVEECLQYSPRIETSRTSEEIAQELNRVNAYLKEKDNQYGGREAFSKKLQKQRETFRLAAAELAGFEELLDYIQKIRRKRLMQLGFFKTSVAVRAKRMFASLIEKRGYRGILELDHDAKNLKLHVF